MQDQNENNWNCNLQRYIFIFNEIEVEPLSKSEMCTFPTPASLLLPVSNFPCKILEPWSETILFNSNLIILAQQSICKQKSWHRVTFGFFHCPHMKIPKFSFLNQNFFDAWKVFVNRLFSALLELLKHYQNLKLLGLSL